MAEVRPAQTRVDDRSTTDLLREIREKAETERGAIMESARRQAEEIEARSQRECNALERQGLADADHEVAAERDRVLGRVREEARKARVELKREAMDGVFSAAEVAIQDRIGGPGWPPALDVLLDEAARFTGPGASVVVAELDLPIARKWAESSSTGCRVSGEPGSRGSVSATSADSRRRAENGLAARIRRVKESGAADIARVLFAAR